MMQHLARNQSKVAPEELTSSMYCSRKPDCERKTRLKGRMMACQFTPAWCSESSSAAWHIFKVSGCSGMLLHHRLSSDWPYTLGQWQLHNGCGLKHMGKKGHTVFV